MNEVDPKVNVVAEEIATKARDIQSSIIELLHKLEMQEKLDWPNMLESFSVLSAQFNSFLQLLYCKPQQRGGVEVKKLAVVPKLLSLHPDIQLQQKTEGRLNCWSHAVAPDYLRTKPEESMETSANILYEKAHQSTKVNPDLLQKHMMVMGKHCDMILACLNDLSDKHTSNHGAANASYSDEDTMTLFLAVTKGEGLQPQRRAQSASIPQPKIPQQGSNIRSQLKAGLHSQR